MKHNINYYIFSFSFFLLIFINCSSYGDIQRLYPDTTRKEIWEAMQEVVIEEFSSINIIKRNPPTIISARKKVDKEFGLDKTEHQATLKLTGFNRPYFVDVSVKKFSDSSEKNHSYDYKYAEKLLNMIDLKLKNNKSKNIFEKFVPL